MGKTDVNVMTGTKVPALRFKGFSDEWVEKKISELSNVVGGGTPSTSNSEYWDGEIEWYAPAEITESDIYVDNSVRKITKLGLEKSSAKVLPSGKTILFTSRAGIGKVAILGKDSATNQGFQSMVVNETTDVYFLFSKMDEIKKEALRKASGSTFLEISGKELRKIKTKVPKLEEQQQIGGVFKTADALIQSEEQKLEQLNQLKKSFLQKMFPKKGTTVPELRFDGFSGEWTEKKLGDVFKRVSVKGRTDLPFITVTETETNVREDSHQGYGNDVSDTAKAKAKVILEGQFLIDLTSYSRGLYLCRMDGLTSNAYNVLDMSVGNEKFWSEYFITHNFVESLKSITPPGARQGKMVEVDSLLKFDIMVPEQDEQVAIGQFFKTFDELIANQEEKVENSKMLKKALLQKMFV